MRVVLQEHPVVEVQEPGATAGRHVHAVAPVKSVARRLAGRHAGNVARGAFITVVAGAANAPYPLLLFAIIVNKAFVERQRVANNVAVNGDMEAAQLFAVAILNHPPGFRFALKVVENVQRRLLLPVVGHFGAAARQRQHQQREAKGQNAFHDVRSAVSCTTLMVRALNPASQ